MTTRAELAARDEAIRSSSEPGAVLARRYRLSPSAVSRIRLRPAPERTRRQRFELEVIAGGWRADCMSDQEWSDWVRQNPLAINDGSIADRPCVDCPLGFAAEMRAIGRCNGQPGAVGGRHEAAEEDDDMIDRPGQPGPRGSAPLELVPPPCGTCAHEPICVLKIALQKAKTAEVAVAPLPDGLSVVVTARVDCRFYTKAKKKLNLTPEDRAQRGQRIRDGAALARAARVAS